MLGPLLLLLCLLAAPSTFGIPSPSIPDLRKDGVDYFSPPSQLYEVDVMLLNEEQVPNALRNKFGLKNASAAFEEGARHKRSPGIKGDKFRWKGGVLNYELNQVVSSKHQTLIRDTLSNLEQKLDSCIKFREVNSGPRVVVVDNGDGSCRSAVGYQEHLESQEISLAAIEGCMNKPTIEHEFLHALGVGHTQNRPDRDRYVEIIEDNINEDFLPNFVKWDKEETFESDLPYDYRSVMHYHPKLFNKGPNLFNRNGKDTMRTYDRSKQEIIGRAYGVSEGDIKLLKKMYNCTAATATTSTTTIITTNATTPTTTAATTTTTATKYEVVGMREDCGSGKEVTTESECREAARELGMDFRFGGSWPDFQRYCLSSGPNVWFNKNTGLAPSKGAPFRAICSQSVKNPVATATTLTTTTTTTITTTTTTITTTTTTIITTKTTTTTTTAAATTTTTTTTATKYEVVGAREDCGSGKEVTTESECRKAARELGMDFRFAGSWGNVQRYCLSFGRKVWFNKDTGLAPSKGVPFRAICSQSVKNPVTSTTTTTTTTTPTTTITTAAPSTCSVSSGPATGQDCVFPFTWRGTIYSGCAEWVWEGEHQGKMWCSTKVDSTGTHVPGPFNYGFCSTDCISS